MLVGSLALSAARSNATEVKVTPTIVEADASPAIGSVPTPTPMPTPQPGASLNTSPTEGGPAACARSSDGSIRCDGPSFKILIDQCVLDHAGVEALQLQLTATTSDLAATKSALALATAPAPIDRWRTLRPSIGLASAILGSAAVGLAASVSWPVATRGSIGAVGLGLVAAGIVIVVP